MGIKILGCGSSLGVPVVGCSCEVCVSTDIRNKRARQALYLEDGGAKILIDFGPDIRDQMLVHNIAYVDGVLITHSHSDHIGGFDDIRALAFENKKAVNVYIDSPTLEVVREKFGYIFDMKFEVNGKVSSVVNVNIIEPYKSYKIKNVEFMAFEQNHGDMISLGFKFERFAYSTDFFSLSEKVINLLSGIDLWILECLGYGDGPAKKAHIRLPRSLELVRLVGPKNAVFIHMSHEIDYEALSDKLPKGIRLAYDGIVL
jgi:phosphoribosyl 1,2-cyclic phosphate phosphodiesterase